MKQDLLPISMDIEASGLDKVRCGIWQIGAVDLNTMEEFLQECRIDDKDEILTPPDADKPVLEVIGKTEEQLRDKQKQPQKKLIQNFFDWVKQKSLMNFLCQNPAWDIGILEIKSRKYGLRIPYNYRSFDLHTTAQNKYEDLRGKILTKDMHSDMGLSNILKLCGMKDERKAHNALEDAKLTAECYFRLRYGKNLFPRYSQYKIPKGLIK